MNDLFSKFPSVNEKEWKNAVQAELKGGDYTQTLCWDTLEGFQVKPLYMQADAGEVTPLVSENNWQIVAPFVPSDKIPYSNLDGVILNLENQAEFYATEQDKIILQVNNSLPPTEPKNTNTYLDWDFLGNLAALGNWTDKSKEKTISTAQSLLESSYKKCLSIDVAHYQNSGANHAEQLALFLSESAEYVNLLGGKVLDKIMLKNAVGSNFFFEIAKLRAARILWQNLCKVYDKESDLVIYSESSLRNKSVLDKYNNIIRSTFETAAAIFGNSDMVNVIPYDYLFKNNSENAHELSFKQQWVLREESFLNHYIDPMQGAYYVENIAKQLAEKAWELFKNWESKGGFIACLEKEIIQKQIAESEQKEQKLFDDKEIKMIGVNHFPNQKDQVILEEIKKTPKRNEKTIFRTIIRKRWAERIENNWKNEE